jgi:hypothetical protein
MVELSTSRSIKRAHLRECEGGPGACCVQLERSTRAMTRSQKPGESSS